MLSTNCRASVSTPAAHPTCLDKHPDLIASLFEACAQKKLGGCKACVRLPQSSSCNNLAGMNSGALTQRSIDSQILLCLTDVQLQDFKHVTYACWASKQHLYAVLYLCVAVYTGGNMWHSSSQPPTHAAHDREH